MNPKGTWILPEAHKTSATKMSPVFSVSDITLFIPRSQVELKKPALPVTTGTGWLHLYQSHRSTLNLGWQATGGGRQFTLPITYWVQITAQSSIQSSFLLISTTVLFKALSFGKNLPVVLIYISLMTHDMCLLDIRISYFLKHLFKSFAHFYWAVSLSIIVQPTVN